MRFPMTYRAKNGLVSLFLAALLTCIASVATAAPKVVLEEGHTDIFNVRADGNRLVLDLKEDVTGQHVLHNPEDVLLVVKESAYSSLPAQVTQVGTPGYYLPMTQDPQLLWPGWDTLGVQSEGFHAIDINFVDVKGPGRVFLFSQGPFGNPAPLLHDGSFELKTGSIREQSYPAHTHAHWVFEKPGQYTMTVNASGTKDGQTVTSNTAVYSWQVGDVPQGDPEPVPSDDPEQPVDPEGPTDEEISTEEETSTEEENPADAETPAEPATPEQPSTPTEQDRQPANLAPRNPVADKSAAETPDSNKLGAATDSQLTATCFPREAGGTGALTLFPKMKDDRSAPPTWRDPQSVPFLLGDAAKATTSQTVGSIPGGTDVWMIGATQVPGVPWVGANTMNESVLNKTTGEVTWTVTSVSGPGSMEVFTSGNFGKVVGHRWFSHQGGSVTIPRNTHVHPNWIFTQPGTYRVSLKQTAQLKDGTPISGTTTLVFNVGTGSGVNEGHFDLGSEVAEAGSRTVWLDKDGNPCTPTAQDYAAAGLTPPGELAKTGVNAGLAQLAFFALGLGVLGAGILRYRAS